MKCQCRTKNTSEADTSVQAWGTLTWMASADLTDSDITFGRVVIYSGKSNPRHCHDTCEEILYLLDGELTHTYADKSIKMNAGDTLVLPAGIMHNATNTGDRDADMIVMYSKGQRDFRLETSSDSGPDSSPK